MMAVNCAHDNPQELQRYYIINCADEKNRFMLRTISLFTVAMILFASCASPSVVTTYKRQNNLTSNIHAVLIAGIIAEKDTVARWQVENYFALELKKLGYHAVPSLTAFGAKGLASLGREETLMKLCNYGFDAVLTIALVDGSKETYRAAPRTTTFAGGYYLERIWNYEKIQADISVNQTGRDHFWECILYDLYALQPVSALQTRLYDVSSSGIVSPELAKRVIAKMAKEKIIRKQDGNARSYTFQTKIRSQKLSRRKP